MTSTDQLIKRAEALKHELFRLRRATKNITQLTPRELVILGNRYLSIANEGKLVLDGLISALDAKDKRISELNQLLAELSREKDVITGKYEELYSERLKRIRRIRD